MVKKRGQNSKKIQGLRIMEEKGEFKKYRKS